MTSKIVGSIIAVSIFVEVGCSSTRALTEEQLRINTNHDILIETKDGRTIKFRSGNYKIVEADSGSIQGKGKLLINGRNESRFEFDGELSFSEIQRITYTEATAIAQIITVVVLGTEALLLLLVLFPPNIPGSH